MSFVHSRFGPELLEDVLTWLGDAMFSTIKFCLAEEKGTKLGHTHYHIWIDGPTPKTIRNRMGAICKSLKIETSQGRGNKYYSVKECDAGMLDYVVKDGKIILHNLSSEQIQTAKAQAKIRWPIENDIDKLIIATSPNGNTIMDIQQLHTHSSNNAQKKKEACHVRFLQYVKTQDCTEMTLKELNELFVQWTKGAYEMRNVSAPIRYAYYMTRPEARKDGLKKALAEEIYERHFSKVFWHDEK